MFYKLRQFYRFYSYALSTYWYYAWTHDTKCLEAFTDQICCAAKDPNWTW